MVSTARPLMKNLICGSRPSNMSIWESMTRWSSSLNSDAWYDHLTIPSLISAGLSLYAVRLGSMIGRPNPRASRAPLGTSGGWPVKNSLRKRCVSPLPVVLNACLALS